MALKCDLTPDDIQRINEMIVGEITEQVLFGLEKLGRECVNRIRDRSAAASWKDQTGNLRSSIGATVVTEGNEFERVPPKLYANGYKGLSVGNKLLDTECKQTKSTCALVVSAGMDYASHLEHYRKRDVLASTKLWAEQQLDSTLDKAVQAAYKRLNAML